MLTSCVARGVNLSYSPCIGIGPMQKVQCTPVHSQLVFQMLRLLLSVFWRSSKQHSPFMVVAKHPPFFGVLCWCFCFFATQACHHFGSTHRSYGLGFLSMVACRFGRVDAALFRVSRGTTRCSRCLCCEGGRKEDSNASLNPS